MTESANLFAQQEKNRRRSKWLVVGFIIFFMWLGFGGDAIRYVVARNAHPDAHITFSPLLGLILTAVSAWFAWSAWNNGPARVIASTGAREIDYAPTNAQEKQLVNVVEEMSVASGIPKPRIWIIPDTDPNAFATGKDEKEASICVTQGLLDTLSRDELQAVIGHEMGHIKNLDVRLMTLLAALVGALALVSNVVTRSGLLGGSRSDREEKDAGPVAIVLLVLWVVSWILAPILANLMALGVSRDREYLADAMGAQFTRNPMSLATALEKIDQASAPTESIKTGTAHMCIADPAGRNINSMEGFVSNLFGTHPPIPMRVARLKAMAYQDMKKSGTFPGEVTA